MKQKAVLPIVFGLDPGTTHSAIVCVSAGVVISHATVSNRELLGWMTGRQASESLQSIHGDVRSGRQDWRLVVEQIESFGMPVGREVFETVWWAGRFFQAWRLMVGRAYQVTRRGVKLHLCQSARAKDANVRQSLIDRFGGTAAVGRKATPGPLYGIHGHEYAALGVALTWLDTTTQEDRGEYEQKESAREGQANQAEGSAVAGHGRLRDQAAGRRGARVRRTAR